jgi:5-methyltetrahydrofolate--homocysteine methyltransferase
VHTQEIASRVTVTDGAWGTQLDGLGCPPGHLHELWNLEHPELVRQVADAYVAAGSQIIITNTFTGNRVVLKKHGMAEKAVELNRAGARISREAAGKDVRVFGSMGPSGQIVMMEEISPQELSDAFREQALALAEGGVDGLLIETMTELAEAVIAVRAAKESTGLTVVASMVFDSGADRCFTSMGDRVEVAAKTLAEAGADVLGMNCGVGIGQVAVPVKRLREATDRPVWLKPNAGLPELHEGRVVFKESPEEFAAHIPELAKIGVNYVGGCCGTTPDHIRAVVAALAKLKH